MKNFKCFVSLEAFLESPQSFVVLKLTTGKTVFFQVMLENENNCNWPDKQPVAEVSDSDIVSYLRLNDAKGKMQLRRNNQVDAVNSQIFYDNMALYNSSVDLPKNIEDKIKFYANFLNNNILPKSYSQSSLAFG